MSRHNQLTTFDKGSGLKYGSVNLQIIGGKFSMGGDAADNTAMGGNYTEHIRSRKPYAIFTHRGITHETQHTEVYPEGEYEDQDGYSVHKDGQSFRFRKESFKLRILDEEDEIVFQLRDFRDQLTAQSNNDNIYGEFKVQMKDLMLNYGLQKEHALYYRPYGDTRVVKVGTLILMPTYVNDFKKVDEEFGVTRNQIGIDQFNNNVRLQEEYIEEQRARMQKQKQSLRQMNELMANSDFAPRVEAVQQNHGRSWPLKIARHFNPQVDKVENTQYVKNTVGYDGYNPRKYEARETKTMTHFGEKVYAIENDAISQSTAQRQRRPNGYQGSMNNSQYSISTNNRTMNPMNSFQGGSRQIGAPNAFQDRRAGDPIKGIKYANYGQDKNMTNIAI